MAAPQRLVLLGDRVCDRLRDERAFSLTEDLAVDEPLHVLRVHRHAVLVTFRRNGDPVPSPVWFAVDAHGRAFVKTGQHAGKVKRLRNDSRVLMAPSSARGRPLGPAVRGTGRLLPTEEWAHAEIVLRSAYGIGRKLSEQLLGGDGARDAYIEVTPRRHLP